MTESRLRALRCFHLLGGCRGHHNTPGWIRLEPCATDVSERRVAAPRYEAAYAGLQKAGLRIIGVDFYTDREQTEGVRLPDWRAYVRSGNTSWLCIDQADSWSHIAYGAIRQGHGKLWDIASRVSHQLRVCDWRIRQLSEAYHDQLSSITRSSRFKHKSCLSDGYTWLGYLALQSFLVDACVLRDYLAECRALILMASGRATATIADLAALKSHYLDKTVPTLDIDKVLTDASREGGWLFALGGYRNLVVHYAPIASADKSLYTYCELTRLDDGSELPSIKLPIPSNPRDIIAARRSGALIEDPNLDYARYLNALRDPASASDSLEYAHTTLGNLAFLAHRLADISPVAPRIPHFNVNERGEVTEE